jgi:hypothetical protein
MSYANNSLISNEGQSFSLPNKTTTGASAGGTDDDLLKLE